MTSSIPSIAIVLVGVLLITTCEESKEEFAVTFSEDIQPIGPAPRKLDQV